MKRIILGSILFLAMPAWANAQQKAITTDLLSKKWLFSHYQVFYFREGPSDKEKGDFIHLKSDMSYASLEEGVAASGRWKLDLKKRKLTLIRTDQKTMAFTIKKLEAKHLVLLIDDPKDEDAQFLDIHFKSN